MNKLLAISLLMGLLGAASAQPIYEPFDYPLSSSLVGQGGWTLFSGTSGTIESGNLPLPPGLPAPIGSMYTWGTANSGPRLAISSINSGSLYFSFALRIDALGNLSLPDFIAGFVQGSGTTFPIKLGIVSNSPSIYQLGIYKATGSVFGTLAPNLLNVGDTEFVVGRYKFNAGSASDDTIDLWLNPSALSFGAAAPPAPTLADIGAGGADATQLDHFFFRAAGTPIVKTVDELRIGTQWSEVVPVPEPGASILSGFGAFTVVMLSLRLQRQMKRR